MQMSEAEIVRSYINATNRSSQIDILAQLNACERDKIVYILENAGIAVPKSGRKKEQVAAVKKESVKAEPVKEGTMAAGQDKKGQTAAGLPDIVKQAICKEMCNIQEKIDTIVEQIGYCKEALHEAEEELHQREKELDLLNGYLEGGA